jgi:Ca2+-transporting ATPase
VTGRDLDALTDDQLAAQVDRIAVYARVSPEHKLRVVKALQARGQVVAMTGDGVNDAPALQAADIGVAMGVTGTDVAKGAAAMVLTDDNFATIVNAVEEGRGIYDDIRNVVHYLLAGNAGKVLAMFAAAVAGWPPPLLAIQILWLNLVTDGLPALGLGVEPPDPGVMRRRPRPPAAPLLPARAWLAIAAQGALTAAAALTGFQLIYRGGAGDEAHARVVAFCVLGLAQMGYALTGRSRTATVAELGPFTNPALLAAVGVSVLLQLAAVLVPVARPVFGVEAAPAGADWALILALAAAPAVAVEAAKVVRRWLRTTSNPRAA